MQVLAAVAPSMSVKTRFAAPIVRLALFAPAAVPSDQGVPLVHGAPVFFLNVPATENFAGRLGTVADTASALRAVAVEVVTIRLVL